MLDWGNLLNAQRAINNTQSMLNAQPPQQSPNLLNVQRAQRATPLLQPLEDIWGKLEKWGLVNSPNAPMEVISRPESNMADKLNAMSNFMFAGNMQNVGKPVAALLGDAARGIKAYHGSPHDFDKFDLSKIGTGEGAQAYGHGLYFAENEGVAKSYRDALAPHNVLRAEDGAVARVEDFTGADKIAATALMRNSEPHEAKFIAGNWKLDDGITREEVNAAIDRLSSRGMRPNAHMYEVNIKADPSTFLDWDKPLSEQPKNVKDYFSQYGIKHDPQAQQEFDDALLRALQTDEPTVVPKQPSNPTGDVLYRKLGSGQFAPSASSRLNNAGIPGIKYLDQGSRASGEGSRNYVVFDPSLIEILRKYGILAPMAGGLGFSNGDNRQ